VSRDFIDVGMRGSVEMFSVSESSLEILFVVVIIAGGE